jgi:hypothetical protein
MYLYRLKNLVLMRKVIAKKGVPPHTGKAFFHSGLEQKWSDNGKILSV